MNGFWRSMHKLAAITLFGLALVAAALPAWAGSASGDAGLPGYFLSYGAGARAMGMGRAFVGLADDATAPFWNAGGLSGITRNQVILQHVSLIDQNGLEYLGYAHMFPYVGNLGLGLAWLHQSPAEGRDTYNELTGDFSSQELGILAAFGTDIAPTLAAGGTAKVVNINMANRSATGFGLDLGIMYRPVAWLNLGLTFQNLVAPEIKLVAEKEKFPTQMTVGVAAKFFDDRLKADLDISKNMDQPAIKPHLGVEISPVSSLFVRAGLDGLVEELNFGAGYQFWDMQLDYAVGLQTVELLHKVSLSYFFGGFILEVRPEPETFSPVGINKVAVIKIACQTKFEVRLWSLEIRNEAEALVKKYSGEGFPPDHIVWDGLQDATNPMPDGRYRISLSLEDSSGEKKKAPDAFVNIQSILPLGVSPVEVLE